MFDSLRERGAFNPDDFLKELNELQCEKFRFVPEQRPDVVVVGSCARDPLDKSFFEECLKGVQSGSTVLLLSNCCGQYVESKVEVLKEMFPDRGYKWMVPPHTDFYGRIFSRETGSFLLWKGFLEVVE